MTQMWAIRHLPNPQPGDIVEVYECGDPIPPEPSPYAINYPGAAKAAIVSA